MDIELKQLTKLFDNKIVLNSLNMSIQEGRINCLMGASGIGKTTLVNIIMGLVKPDFGEVMGLQGKQIAAVFQEDRLIEHWNAIKNIELVCGRDITKDRIIQELTKLNLQDDKDKPVKDYSGGMRRRVAIVRAILAQSELLILDEPFRGLDLDLKRKTIEYIKQSTKGKTVIIVTHERDDVALLEANLITLV